MTENMSTHGFWSIEERELHINVLELMAILFSLKALLPEAYDTHITIICDNTTSVHTINNMGTGKSQECNKVVQDIWEWARSSIRRALLFPLRSGNFPLGKFGKSG